MEREKPRGPLYYADYIQTDRLLGAQQMQSALRGRPAHDEMLFIIVHQTYELWFKQILWELDAVLETFRSSPVPEEKLGQAILRLGRIVEIQRVMIQQVDVLETMTPLDFLDFRDDLMPASGLQSVQFRLVENKLGMRRGDRLQLHGAPYTSRLSEADAARVEASEKEPSLFDLIEGWLERTPFLHFGDFDFWREYRRAVEAMLARDRASIRSNPTLTEDEKTTQLAGVEATARRFADVFEETAGEPGTAPGAPLFPTRAPGGAPHQSLSGRADPAPALPPAGDPRRHRKEFHDLAPAPRPDGDADDRHPDRHRRHVGARVSRPGGRASQGVRGPLGSGELLHSPVGASQTSSRSEKPHGIRTLRDDLQLDRDRNRERDDAHGRSASAGSPRRTRRRPD